MSERGPDSMISWPTLVWSAADRCVMLAETRYVALNPTYVGAVCLNGRVKKPWEESFPPQARNEYLDRSRLVFD